ncbi:hypothetical protein FFF34_010480 [Inquilinus sp. KBS0705]|nr:hypothetical protein FFF34_010480 [Inquilinus sp. KBS0705]
MPQGNLRETLRGQELFLLINTTSHTVLVYFSLMKLYFTIVAFVLFTGLVFAQEPPISSQAKKDSAGIVPEAASPVTFVAIEQSASYPGGDVNFMRYVTNSTSMPELVGLFGFKGRIVIGFTVDVTGKPKNIKAFSESGTGFEESLSVAIQNSPRWKPAIQNSRVIEQSFTIPFKFDISRPEISIKELKKSSYKFTFQIKDKTYSIEEAEPILGNVFSADRIDYAKSFAEQPEENRKSKKYLIQIKD